MPPKTNNRIEAHSIASPAILACIVQRKGSKFYVINSQWLYITHRHHYSFWTMASYVDQGPFPYEICKTKIYHMQHANKHWIYASMKLNSSIEIYIVCSIYLHRHVGLCCRCYTVGCSLTFHINSINGPMYMCKCACVFVWWMQFVANALFVNQLENSGQLTGTWLCDNLQSAVRQVTPFCTFLPQWLASLQQTVTRNTMSASSVAFMQSTHSRKRSHSHWLLIGGREENSLTLTCTIFIFYNCGR